MSIIAAFTAPSFDQTTPAMIRFEFATASRVIFGRGCSAQLAALCQPLGSRILLVTGSRPERAEWAVESLRKAGMSCEIFSIQGEPKLGEAVAGAEMARKKGIQVVVGIGGGSAVDAGKAIAALAPQPKEALHYLEVVGKGQALDHPSLPCIALPTTAGTGAEVTRNAVLSCPEHAVKASLRHASMLPQVALIDPELARDCPAAVTAASGMDALTQCLEAYVSCRAQPMTDALCAEGIRRAVRSLEKAVQDGSDLEAREDMALAALFSGMALANAGLGAVHGFAAPIGGKFHAPHGAVCAALLAPVWKANAEIVQKSADSRLQERFQQAAGLLTGQPKADPQQAEALLRQMTKTLGIPSLRSFGLQEDHLCEMAEKASRASSMKGNPVSLPQEQLIEILREAL